MTDVNSIASKFRELLFRVADEQEQLYQVKREVALIENKPYLIFDRNNFISRIDEFFFDKDYISLWQMYFSYLAFDRKEKIIHADPIAIEFFNNIILNIVNENQYSIENNISFVKNLIKKLESEGMYEEIQLFKYSLAKKDHALISFIVGSPIISDLARVVNGYEEFVAEFDPRG